MKGSSSYPLGLRDFGMLTVIALGLFLILFFIYPTSHYPDSNSYIKSISIFLNGGIHRTRTPVYPMVIYFCQLIRPIHWEKTLEIFQFIVFLVSLWCFYSLSLKLTGKKNLSFIAALVYIFAAISWTTAILTESLAISGTIVLVYFTYRLIYYNNPGDAILTMLLLPVLILLRPFFIFLIPGYFLFNLWLFYKKGCNRQTWMALLVFLMSIVPVGLYMKEFQKEYQLLALSDVGTFNQLHILVKFRVVDNTDPESPFFFNHEEKNVGDLYDRRDLKGNSEIINNAIRENFPFYVKALLLRLYFAGYGQDYNSILNMKIDPLLILANGSFGFIFQLDFVYTILFLYTFYIILSFWRGKKLPVFCIYLYFFTITGIFVAVAGAQAEWGRLCAPVYPLFILICVQYLSGLKIKYK